MLIDSFSSGKLCFLFVLSFCPPFLQLSSFHSFCLQATESINRNKVISKIQFSSSESLIISVYIIEMEQGEFIVGSVYSVFSTTKSASSVTLLKIHHPGRVNTGTPAL